MQNDEYVWIACSNLRKDVEQKVPLQNATENGNGGCCRCRRRRRGKGWISDIFLLLLIATSCISPNGSQAAARVLRLTNCVSLLASAFPALYLRLVGWLLSHIWEIWQPCWWCSFRSRNCCRRFFKNVIVGFQKFKSNSPMILMMPPLTKRKRQKCNWQKASPFVNKTTPSSKKVFVLLLWRVLPGGHFLPIYTSLSVLLLLLYITNERTLVSSRSIYSKSLPCCPFFYLSSFPNDKMSTVRNLFINQPSTLSVRCGFKTCLAKILCFKIPIRYVLSLYISREKWWSTQIN